MKYNTKKSLQSIIDNRIEESKKLEFKRAEALSRDSKKKEELAKDISAFANSDGGIIIYGIKEDNHIPTDFSFINGNEFTREWLEDVIDSNITPKIQNILIEPIRIDKDIKKTIYVIEIPRSQDSPHMAKANRYYRRYNFKSVPMEEYEIRNLYFKSGKTILKIKDILVSGAGASTQHNKLNSISYNLNFQIKNEGKIIEKLYKLEVRIPASILFSGVQMTQIEKAFVRVEGDNKIYSIPNKSPLFQGELTTLWTIPIEINKHNNKRLNEYKIGLKLYYTNGIDTKEVFLSEILFYKENKLKIEDFN